MASAYQFLEPAYPGVSATATSQQMRLGLVAPAFDATLGYAEFMYVRGASASAATGSDLCLLLTGYSAQQAVSGNTASQGPCGFAPQALSATNVFGWMQIMGVVDYAQGTNTSTGAEQPVFIATTAGQVHVTGSATGFRVDGAYYWQYSNTTNSKSVSVYAYYPVFNGR